MSLEACPNHMPGRCRLICWGVPITLVVNVNKGFLRVRQPNLCTNYRYNLKVCVENVLSTKETQHCWARNQNIRSDGFRCDSQKGCGTYALTFPDAQRDHALVGAPDTICDRVCVVLGNSGVARYAYGSVGVGFIIIREVPPFSEGDRCVQRGGGQFPRANVHDQVIFAHDADLCEYTNNRRHVRNDGFSY